MDNEVKNNPQDQQEDRLAECQQKVQEYLNGWKRTQADFANYKKAEEKRFVEFAKFAQSQIILDLLEALDTLSMAVKHTPESLLSEYKDWLQGLEQGLRQLEDILQKYGIERIKADQVVFDPNLHEMIGTGEADDKASPSDELVQEIRPGYTLHGKVIRPARVRSTSRKS